MAENPARLDCEKIAYWFFRLNGCLTIENFVVHPDLVDRQDAGQRTDADLLAVRFPFRSELHLYDQPMEDHDLFSCDKVHLLMVEVKRGQCSLDGPWTDPERRNLHRVLSAVGILSPDRIEKTAEAIYTDKLWEDEQVRIEMVAAGGRKTEESVNYTELTFPDDLLPFIYQRFTSYRRIKSSHAQWDPVGQDLYDRAVNAGSEGRFVETIMGQV